MKKLLKKALWIVAVLCCVPILGAYALAPHQFLAVVWAGYVVIGYAIAGIGIIIWLSASAAFAAFSSIEPGALIGLIMLFVLLGVGLGFYFLPTIIAIVREHKNVGPIIAINVCFGWTFLGWVAALFWATTNDTVVVLVAPQPLPTQPPPLPVLP